MLVRSARIFALLVIAGFGVGCSGDNGNGIVALEDYPSAGVTEFCRKAFECCTTAEIPQHFGDVPFRDEAGCIEHYTTRVDEIVAQYQASIEAGNLEYNGSNASECLAAIRAQSCVDFAGGRSVIKHDCDAPLVGKIALNGACHDGVDCASGYCEVPAGYPPPGQCKALPTAGERCDGTCADGLYCARTLPERTCLLTKQNAALCDDNDECASGVCNGDAMSSQGTCGAPQSCNGR